MSKGLTCVAQHGSDVAGGPLEAVVGHAVVSLHREGVVEVRLHVADRHDSVAQASGGRLKVHPFATRRALAVLAVLAGHAVGHVTTATCVLRGAPGQLETAGRERRGDHIAGGTGRSCCSW